MRSWDDYKKTMKPEDPIFDFARNGDLTGIQSVLSKTNLNQQDTKGYSPLMLAAYNGHLEVTNFLLDQGADPNSSDNTGNTILMGVAFKGHLDILKLLIKHGANPNAKNTKNQDALQFAQMFGRTDIAKLLSNNKDFKMTDQISSWLTYVFPRRLR